MNKYGRPLAALSGHVLDLYRLATFSFINPHSYTKFRLLSSLQSAYGAEVFLETGTYLGVTTGRCARSFKKVFSVELDEELAIQAKQNLISKKNVDVIQGDALQILPNILSKRGLTNVLVFLDGHFSGGLTASSDLPEPALEELKVIAQYKDKVCAIVIDDFRSFGVEPGFPKKSELLQLVEKLFENYMIQVHLDQLIIKR